MPSSAVAHNRWFQNWERQKKMKPREAVKAAANAVGAGDELTGAGAGEDAGVAAWQLQHTSLPPPTSRKRL